MTDTSTTKERWCNWLNSEISSLNNYIIKLERNYKEGKNKLDELLKHKAECAAAKAQTPNYGPHWNLRLEEDLENKKADTTGWDVLLKKTQAELKKKNELYNTYCSDNPTTFQKFKRSVMKYPNIYNSDSLQVARNIAEKQGKKLVLTDYEDLKQGVIYYVVVPVDEREVKRPIDEVAFVRLSEKQAETADGTKTFNIYDDDGKLSKTYVGGTYQAPGGWYEVKTVTLPNSYYFVDADTLLSAPQSAGNKRKKHSSNKLSKRHVKTKSRRRNNITHRRKQRR
jgi:hypothetical protein